MARPEQISSSSFDTIVTDMDGTVYSFKGESNRYKGSTLEQAVKNNLTKLIVEQDGLSFDEALQLVESVEASGKYFSVHFGQKYNLTRKDFFDIVWDINPDEHIANFEIPKKKLQELKSKGKKIVLLTSAPSMWAKRVVQHLGLDRIIDEIITAEYFDIKSDIFKRISQEYIPGRTLSIGDQEDTDIIPAEELGLITLHISHPREFSRII